MDNNGFDKIVDVKLEDEMRSSYIDYAMSVIVSRALPDVRDGLKPVHRRILYAMNELNLDPSKAHKKSARIVGDTMGKYHPHGESSIYEALVRLAQDFNTRYMLVDGHGNFGSIDGDRAAAQRYTEARLSKISTEMISDIDKETVDFVPNYAEEFMEPTVLPARIPNLLINGSSGIAVGMATNIPPHNLTEVSDALLKILDNRINEDRDTDIDEIMQIIKGPDFPTGANILGVSGIKQAYLTGRGKVIIRATAEIEEIKSGRSQIIVTEFPYQVNKSKVLEKIAELVSDKRIEGISDIRDESNRDGIRVVIELKKDVNANVVLNNLYKNSQMQESFGIIMLALVNNEPKVLNIKEMLVHYLEHQRDVVTRRTQFDLNKAQKRAHILEGLMIALDNIDEVINIIRSSKDTLEAKQSLSERFNLSEEQSTAIVEMRLRSLTGLEREKLESELNSLLETIKYLEGILNDETTLLSVIRDEANAIKIKYGDERRTQLLNDPGEIDYEDLINEENSVITLSYFNYIKRIPLNTYKSQNRGGKGIIGMQMRDEDLVKNIFVVNTHDTLLYFTSKGRVFSTKAYVIPESGRTAKGIAGVNLLNLEKGEKIAALLPVRDFNEGEQIVLVTKKGVVKKTQLSNFKRINKSGLIAISFRGDDELISVIRTDGEREIFVVTKNGYGVRFSEKDVRSMGRTAAGVRAIRLSDDDIVIGSDSLDDESKVFVISEKGFGKCTELDSFTLRHRGGKGVKVYKISERTGNVIGVSKAKDEEEIMIINSEGVIIRIKVSDISTKGRVTQGVKLINLKENEKVVNIAKITEEQLEAEAIEEELELNGDSSYVPDEESENSETNDDSEN